MSDVSLEPKKLVTVRILQVLFEHSDYNHPITQEKIIEKIRANYGLEIERKAVGRNISLLNEAGFVIESDRRGCWLCRAESEGLGCGFDDSELRILIDGVLSAKYIPEKYSKALIEKLCGLSNKHFKSHVKHIHSVSEWSKTDNKQLFYNIEVIDEAIEAHRQIQITYSKYDTRGKLVPSKEHFLSPYQLILRNQRYYLMAYNERWKTMTFLRVDHILEISVLDEVATGIKTIPGYEQGINYKNLANALPYMYTDAPERITLRAAPWTVDQIFDWFGSNAKVVKTNADGSLCVQIVASTMAMEFWALQFCGAVEVIEPQRLREKVKSDLKLALEKYTKK